ncbi:MAG: glycerophosphodiester phosphodiesterase [Actinomycetota bacterium]
MIGHRGAPAAAPENTLSAFAAALAANVDGVEFDVRLTRDSRLVVMHDDDVSRTTDGTGCISAMTLDEVRTLRLKGARAERVPTFDEVVALVHARVRMYVELKTSWCNGVFSSAEPVARALAPRLAALDATVSSSDHTAVELVRALEPRARTAVTIARGGDVRDAIRSITGHAEVHISSDDADATSVDAAHAAGLEVLVWTVNEPARARELQRLGVDGIFTDDPVAIASVSGGGDD